MVPQFKQPISAFALCAVGVGCWLAAGALLVDALVADEALASVTIPALILLASGLPLFGLGRIVGYSAESAHYLKYICWEQRLANQLAEKKQSDQRKIPPPLQNFHELDPMERVYRSIEE